MVITTHDLDKTGNMIHDEKLPKNRVDSEYDSLS